MLDLCLLRTAGTMPLRRRRLLATPLRVGGTVVQTAEDARNVRLRRRLSYCASGATLKPILVSPRICAAPTPGPLGLAGRRRRRDCQENRL